MSLEFSGKIQFTDSAQQAYSLRVFVKDDWRHGFVDVAIWCNTSWEKLCEALMDVEKMVKKKGRISKPINRGHLHVVR